MKRVISFALCLLTVVMPSCTVYAASNYKEYAYNTSGEAVPAPMTYEPVEVLNGGEETGIQFSRPQDIVHDDDGNLYVLDSGNDRIVVYDSMFNLIRVIMPPVIDGVQLAFTGCMGLFATKSELYITDKEKGMIYILSHEGNGIKIITFTPQAIVDDKFIFKPIRMTVDDTGIMQVQAEDCYNGLITLDQNGKMIGYFSANTIQASVSVMAAQFWRKIFSDEQQDSIKQIIPVEYSAVTMDSEGFIYTTTKKTENSTFEIKKLNPYGSNILGYNDKFSSVRIGNGNYGDQRTLYKDGKNVDTTFEDIYVDSKGFIFALDTARGRVFQYDGNSNLVSIFGGIGNQKGTFALPAAVSGYKEQIFILDETKNSITVFEPNDYVRNIQIALSLDDECEYIQAAEYWQKVYETNSNYSLALSGLGKAAYEKGNLSQAMQYFERADDRANYDIAYNASRTKFVRENFGFIGLGALILTVGVILLLNRLRRREQA